MRKTIHPITPTLGQIAAELNVSRSTVSYVLLGQEREKRISQAMAARVREAAKRLNYRPDGAARSLYERKSYQIGLLLRNAADRPLTTPSAFEFMIGVNLMMEKAGYVVTLIRIGDVHADSQPQSRVFREHMLDGVIVFGDLPPSIYARTTSLSEACIWANSSPFGARGYIRRDEVHAGQTVAQMAMQNGYQRLVWLGPRAIHETAFPDEIPHYSQHDRYRGLKEVADQNHLACETILLDRHVHQNDLVREVRRLAAPDTAFVAYDTGIVMRAILAAGELGLRLGQDVGLACCDEWEILRNYWPSMSRVTHDLLTMGQTAAQMLLSIVGHPQADCPSLQIRGDWHPGTTLGSTKISRP